MKPRWHGWRRWLHRVTALALISGLLLPAAAPGALAATYDPSADADVAKQAVGGDTRVRTFEDLTAEDLFSQPIYEVVKADWDKQYKPVTGVSVAVPAASYTASGGLEDLR